jgi:hypothetical protein
MVVSSAEYQRSVRGFRGRMRFRAGGQGRAVHSEDALVSGPIQGMRGAMPVSAAARPPRLIVGEVAGAGWRSFAPLDSILWYRVYTGVGEPVGG